MQSKLIALGATTACANPTELMRGCESAAVGREGTLPFQGYSISAVEDGVSSSVTETIQPGVMASVQFSALGEMVLDLRI